MRYINLWRKAIFVVVILLIFLFPINSTATSNPAKFVQSTVVFTPQITPVNITATLEPTFPTTLRHTPGASPLPHPQSTVEPFGTAEPEPKIVGGTKEYGYQYLEGSEPPTWVIFWGDEKFLFSPDDPAEAALLDEFRDKVEDYADEIEDIDTYREELKLQQRALRWEGAGVITGSVAAIFGCAGVPLTFWFAGGSGWACAGGIGAAISSAGAGIVTITEINNTNERIAKAEEKADQAFEKAEGLFRDLVRQHED